MNKRRVEGRAFQVDEMAGDEDVDVGKENEGFGEWMVCIWE